HGARAEVVGRDRGLPPPLPREPPALLACARRRADGGDAPLEGDAPAPPAPRGGDVVSGSGTRARSLRAAVDAVTVERVDSVEGIAALGDDWDRVQDACPAKHVLMDHRWVSAWWRHFGEGKELHVLAVRRGGRLAAVAPLVLSRGREAFPARDSRLVLADDYAHMPTPSWMRVVPIR